MAELTASRTLVKSNPELWAECSDAASLARHLGAFGEIRITRLEPETAVAWEGEDVRGTVTLEPSGWGTRVVLTAQTPTDAEEADPGASDVPPRPIEAPGIVAPAAEATSEDVPEQLADDAHDEPEAIEPGLAPRRGLFGRLFGFWRRPAPAELEPLDPEEPAPVEPAPAVEARALQVPAAEAVRAQGEAPAADTSPPSEVLLSALDSLGQAHRRPFSHG